MNIIQSIIAAFKRSPKTIAPAPEPKPLFDARTEKALASLDPKAVPAFRKLIAHAKELCAEAGLDYVAISGNRTWAEQNALYAKGRTTKGPKVTNAKGGHSNHNFGIALDFGVFRAGKYLDGGTKSEQAEAMKIHARVADHAHALGIEWGGSWKSFKDFPHFEIKTGLTLAQKRERFQKTGSVFSASA